MDLNTFAVVGTLAFLAWAVYDQHRQRARLRLGPGDRVLVLGDSLAQGLGPPFRALGQAEGIEVSVDAASGTSIGAWRGREPQLVATHRPTKVLVSLGTNDAAGGAKGAARFAAEAQALVRALGAQGAVVFWLVPPPMPFSLAAIADAQRATDAPRLRPPPSLPRAADGIHLPPSGYEAWASYVWGTLEAL